MRLASSCSTSAAPPPPPRWGNTGEKLRGKAGGRKDDGVVLVKNEEVVDTSLSASEFLSLYNGIGRGGSEAVR